jgi:hypothetical protein
MTIDKKILGDLENSLTFCACVTDIFIEKIILWNKVCGVIKQAKPTNC